LIGDAQAREFPHQYSFTLKWGSMGTADGQFLSPHGIAIDSQEVAEPQSILSIRNGF
jgi:hypothetical protein